MSDTIQTPVVDGTAKAPEGAPSAAEQAARMAALAPANIPDKFKLPDGTVNLPALVTAYSEAEKAKTRAEQTAALAGKATEQRKDEKVVNLDEAFKSAPAGPTLWTTAQAELQAEGNITPATREALKAQGVTDVMLDGVVNGHKAARAEHARVLADAVGGGETLTKAIQYAKSHYKEAELAELRRSLETAMGPTIIRGIVAEMNAQAPNQTVVPSREPAASIMDIAPGKSGPEITPFTSQAEMLAVFRDPRYRTSPEFREYAGRRMLATQNR